MYAVMQIVIRDGKLLEGIRKEQAITDVYKRQTYGLTNEKKIDNAIGIVANENKYHPIRDYLNTLVWDGTEPVSYTHLYLSLVTALSS